MEDKIYTNDELDQSREMVMIIESCIMPILKY